MISTPLVYSSNPPKANESQKVGQVKLKGKLVKALLPGQLILTLLICSVKVLSHLYRLSLYRTVKVDCPAVVGVPSMTPVPICNVKPVCKLPAIITQEGEVPGVSVIVN